MKIFITLLLLIPCLSWGGPITEKTTEPNSVNAKGEHNYQISSEIIRLGNSSQRFELNHGECGQDQYWDDCTNDRQRIERAIVWKGLNHTKWFGLVFLLTKTTLL